MGALVGGDCPPGMMMKGGKVLDGVLLLTKNGRV